MGWFGYWEIEKDCWKNVNGEIVVGEWLGESVDKKKLSSK